MEIESAALETSTKSRYEAALRLMEKSNPWLLPMRGVLNVKMGFAHLRGKKANEIGLLRGTVKWWHHREVHSPPPFEDPSLAYFFTGLKKLADNTVKEKERLSREEIGKIIDWWVEKGTLDATRNVAITVLAFFPTKWIGEILGRGREDFMVKRTAATPLVLYYIHRSKGDPYRRGTVYPIPLKAKDASLSAAQFAARQAATSSVFLRRVVGPRPFAEGIGEGGVRSY
uniref:Uncharacterized protein n=1 Tax=Chromera velia CCMP2878 TaxID=1169474 RepID=A0A0G4IC49_9ALVE|eukprot:Cvel_12929.t1-p1 / transcript=Cvel_12929.t1 / gene=Cvel_12929 / organism=Chromera_velia_CCMP2878 / gene_product=hypothetical protein / transcript_product=hypothetical protein / location=Cvel_scaffold864:50046-53251(-) / protein_length=227 / sequence_SO=supercontig / SO=protein_coding / is_pseudo=false